MFKSLKYINLKIKVLLSLIQEMINIQKQIDEQLITYNSYYSSVSYDLNKYITEAKLRNKTIKFFNNQKSAVSNAITINSSNSPVENSNFIVDTYGAFSANTTGVDFFENFKKTISTDSKSLVVDFDEPIELNALSFSFTNKDGDPVIPKQIFLGDTTGKSIYEPWMKKIKRSVAANFFTNEFSFSCETAKKITFVFEGEFSDISGLSFFRKKYSTECSAIFKVPYSGFNVFSVWKNEYTEFVELDYYYSFDSETWLPLLFKDNNNVDSDTALITLKNKYVGDDFFVKVVRGVTKNSLFKDEYKVVETILDLAESKIDDVSYKLEIPNEVSGLSIVVDAEIYNLFKEKQIDFFSKSSDGLFLIESDKLTRIKEIDSFKLLKLKNQNDYTVYDTDILPSFYLTEANKLYLPQCFGVKNLTVIYSSEEKEELVTAVDFTPILFSLEFNFEG